MVKTTFINVLSGFTKLLIFPFFYFSTFLLTFISVGFISGSFSKNYGEAIEGIALGTVIVAPLLLLIFIPLTLLVLLKTRKLHYLYNDWFLVLLGIGSAGTCVFLLLALEWFI